MKKNCKGFTLMEMLIVVAIIAVLTAISIPTFNGTITKAKEGVDLANVRSACAEFVAANLSDSTPFPKDKTEFIEKYNLNLYDENNLFYNFNGMDVTVEYELTYSDDDLCFTATDATKRTDD